MGPLEGFRIIEFAGYGPGPFAGMVLSDMGAEVVRVERPTQPDPAMDRPRRFEAMIRNRRSVIVDLGQDEGREVALRLLDAADALIEGYRPGVMERLGLGPDICLDRNPRLVYGRITGWGQDGPLASTAGHDINYISLTGALHAIGPRSGPPVPPLALLGDMGGGGMSLALGICAALLERERSGEGQVIDASIFEGAANLMAAFYGFHASGAWVDERGANRTDGGAPFYRTYECAGGGYISVGALEDRFFDILCDGLGLSRDDVPERLDRSRWEHQSRLFEDVFQTRTRDEWCEVFADSDACVTPVLSLSEAPEHPHVRARGTFVDLAGVLVPGPAPRFSRSPSAVSRQPVEPGEDTEQVLADVGFAAKEIDRLIAAGVVRSATSGT